MQTTLVEQHSEEPGAHRRPLYCTHADCRAHAAEELRFIARAIHKPWLGGFARDLVKRVQQVRCRRRPRKGAVLAPFPGEELAA